MPWAEGHRTQDAGRGQQAFSHTGNVHGPEAQGGDRKNWPSFCLAEGLRSSHSEPGGKDKRTHLIEFRAGLIWTCPCSK